MCPAMGRRKEEEERVEGGVVAVTPKPNKGITSKAIDWLEKMIVKLMYDSSDQPLQYLSGNFAPVPETPPCTDLPVEGYLPECLNGEFFQVGPNPKVGPVAGYHWFDGDSMIHGLRIKNGKATYVSRYVETSRLKQEEFFGEAKFAKVGDLNGLFGLLMIVIRVLREKLKVLDLSYGDGTGNTALVYHHGKLLALHERDKPYVIKVLEDGDLQTLGMLDYKKRLAHSFTSHPKVDPVTGEMFTFGTSYTPPYITYRVISRDGFMQDPVPVTISDPAMMHDFAITENYAIIMDLPLYIRPKELLKNIKLPFKFDAAKAARFGILPRYAKDELLIRWFELPSCFIFHTANAWEEGDEVVLITCRYTNFDLDMICGKVKETFENFTVELFEMRFNMKTGLASQKKLSKSAVEFPKVNESYTGRKQQFVYGSIMGSMMKVRGVIKFDLHAKPESGKTKLEVGGNIQGIFDLGPGRFGSEVVFVPRKLGITSEEDDGYLIFFVHDETSGKSEVNVIDAKTMSADPVAVVELPKRVPYGFHALFVTETQINMQSKDGTSTYTGTQYAGSLLPTKEVGANNILKTAISLLEAVNQKIPRRLPLYNLNNRQRYCTKMSEVSLRRQYAADFLKLVHFDGSNFRYKYGENAFLSLSLCKVYTYLITKTVWRDLIVG